jgi:hypothetical protein
MENLLCQYPELPWNIDTAPHRLALYRPLQRKPRDLITSIQSVIPRSWSWSKAEREMRPEAYKLDMQGVPGLEAKCSSMTVTVITGVMVSLASSLWILVPSIIMSFQGGENEEPCYGCGGCYSIWFFPSRWSTHEEL